MDETLVTLAKNLLKAMEHKQDCQHAYSQGSASISEAQEANDSEYRAYSELWDFIKQLEEPKKDLSLVELIDHFNNVNPKI